MGPLPLNALSRRIFCHHCQTSVEANDVLAWLPSNFGDLFWGNIRTWRPGERKKNHRIKSPMQAEAEIREPSCRGCNAVLPQADLGAALAAGNPVHCRTCNATTPVRRADDLARSIVGSAVAVIDEMLVDAAPAAQEPIYFSCLQCGAGLPVDGTQRVVTCKHCSGSSFLPDPLWLRMHPAAKMRWFYIAF
jgi:hypothetical protein